MKSVHLALKIPNFANIKMTVFQRKTMMIHSLSLIFMSSARNELFCFSMQQERYRFKAYSLCFYFILTMFSKN